MLKKGILSLSLGGSLSQNIFHSDLRLDFSVVMEKTLLIAVGPLPFCREFIYANVPFCFQAVALELGDLLSSNVLVSGLCGSFFPVHSHGVFSMIFSMSSLSPSAEFLSEIVFFFLDNLNMFSISSQAVL